MVFGHGAVLLLYIAGFDLQVLRIFFMCMLMSDTDR